MDQRKADQGTQVISWIDQPPRWLIVSALVIVCGLAFALRCLHLLRDDHYFIISPDSHYFHRMAQLLVEGETYFYPTHGQLFPIDMFSGITYPLAAIARALALLTPASSGDALELASKLLPPALGVITALVLYFAVSRLYGRMVGLFAAFAWAVVPMGIVHQSAGYLDRDCLSILLIICGVFSFYFLSDSRTSRGFGRLNWLACAPAVVGVEILLYISWGFLGPVILLIILVAFLFLQVLNSLMARVMPSVLKEEDPVRMALTFVKGSLKPLPAVLRSPLSRSIALILALHLALVALRPGLFRNIYDLGADVFRGAVGGQQTVAELQGMGLADIQIYSFLLIPAVAGIYVCAKRRNRADIVILGWFAVLFLAGVFSRRLFIYAAPGICILAAVGFGALLDTKGLRTSLTALLIPSVNWRGLVPYLRIGLAILVITLTVYNSLLLGYLFASDSVTSADNDWQDALIWLRQHSAQDAVVMTWWDYGYWIFDIAQRVPVADNGYHPYATDADIARVYCAFDDSEATTIMIRYGADYLVFPQRDTRLFPFVIDIYLNDTYGDGNSISDVPDGCLYARSFSEAFHSDAGLERVYQSPNSSIVILALT